VQDRFGVGQKPAAAPGSREASKASARTIEQGPSRCSCGGVVFAEAGRSVALRKLIQARATPGPLVKNTPIAGR